MSPFVRGSRGVIALLVVLALAATAAPATGGPQKDSISSPSRPDFGSPKSIAEFVAAARQARARDDFRAASGRLVVKFSSEKAALSKARRHGWRVLDTVLGDGSVVLRVPRGLSVRDFAISVRGRARVAYAEPDFRMRALGHTGEAHDWGYDTMNVQAAYESGATGDGVIVAIVDSGVDYLHEDLDDNIWTNPGEIPDNGIDDEGNGFVDDVRGYDFQGNFFTSLDPDNDPMDALGHGTHVAGIVAAEDNGIGVIGVAPDATIMPVRVLDDVGAGWDSQIAKGIRYAVDNGADVINMSLGGYFFSSLMRDAVEYAHDNGVTVVAAAGNEFFYSIASFPAGYPSVISVAAGEKESLGETKTWWSNWGNVDFLAPGEEVLSTTPDDTYQRFSGTSMASPQVAGAVALVKETYASLPLPVDASPDQLEQALAVTADARYFGGKDEVSGSGSPNLGTATSLPLAGAQVELYRDPHLVASDGSEATITLRMLDGDGDPQVGKMGTFSTTAGTLSPETFTTDANGEAETNLSLEDFFGVATVTADPDDPTAPSRDIRVMVEDDRVRVDDAMVAPAVEFEDEFFVEEDASAEVLAGVYNGEPEPPEGEEDPLGTLLVDPGEDVVITAFLGNHRFGDPKRASVHYEVTGPGGSVPELEGDIEPIDVGFGGRDFLIWISQERDQSLILTIPEDAATGRYELTVEATTLGSGKTDTYTTPFWVGVVPKILVVREPFYFNAETFNYFDFSNPTIDWGLKAALDNLGLSFHYANGFPPGPGAMRKFSTVLWLGDWGFLDTFTLQEYLDRGGNVLLSGEIWASDDRRFPTRFFRDYLHLSGVLAPFFPDLNNQIYPASVSGLSGMPSGFPDGVMLNIHSYDLNTTGEPTAIFTDELVAQADPAGVSSDQAEYPSGVHDPALAGRHVDDGNFRALYLGFGIEAMDDDESGMSFENLLGELVFDVFNPPATITQVVPNRLTTRGGRFRILGTNFQRTGTTTVKVGNRVVPARVISRTEISARLPAGFRPGLYDVKVKNPIGAQVKKDDALRVVRA